MATTALIIMDGFGIGGNDPVTNAILSQGTPNLDRLKEKYSFTAIGASGEDVGLPDGQMGNSEVGHTNIGAGRVVYQMLVKISKDIREGVFFENPAMIKAMENCKKNDSALHLIGLVSPGGVHSHTNHLYGILEMAKKHGLEKVYVHALLDGRDVPPDSGWEYVQELVNKMEEIGVGKIATTMGRLYAMDRDNAWERVEKAYNAMVMGEGNKAEDPVKAIRDSYEVIDETGKHLTDEFVLPTVLDENGMIQENDSVVFFNFRPDRAREITRAFVDPDFKGFVRKKGFFPLTYICMTQYDATMPNVTVAYPPESLSMTMGEYLSKCSKTQLRIAETQKYAHVTFFFNGGEETKFEGEDRILVPSPSSEEVPTFDLKPEMSAYEVTEAVLPLIREDKYDVIILNYANCDMVGHTGVIDATKKAVKAVDECVGKVVDAITEMGGKCIVTADHGNADMMIDPVSGGPFTAHTTNPVPVIVIDPAAPKKALREGGRLSDLCPTILTLMGLEQPKEMTGESLIIG
ncbi:MAG: 2,3-bisphosphoglycerate-independent phosphoglycerate mutase [Clostridia bacterium]|nr:2,3-bisphosphoglycerate-independent phosphoglycerate mutase [Clostridia bacterium]